MKTKTLLEVMAEVGRQSDRLREKYVTSSSDDEVSRNMAEAHVRVAATKSGAARRDALLQAAAWAILALHAHDAEVAQSSVDRAGHGPGCKVDRAMSHCTFDCPKRRARAADAKETR